MRLFTPSFNLKIFFYFLLLFFLTKHTLNKNVSPINKKLNLDSLWYEKLAHARRPNPLRERNLKHDMLRFCTKFIFLCMFNKKQREAYVILWEQRIGISRISDILFLSLLFLLLSYSSLVMVVGQKEVNQINLWTGDCCCFWLVGDYFQHLNPTLHYSI